MFDRFFSPIKFCSFVPICTFQLKCTVLQHAESPISETENPLFSLYFSKRKITTIISEIPQFSRLPDKTTKTIHN